MTDNLDSAAIGGPLFGLVAQILGVQLAARVLRFRAGPYHRCRTISDEEWVRWVAPLFDGVLGKDNAHRYTPREKHLIIELKLRVFTFSSGNLNGLKMAQLLKAALPQIERCAAAD